MKNLGLVLIRIFNFCSIGIFVLIRRCSDAVVYFGVVCVHEGHHRECVLFERSLYV